MPDRDKIHSQLPRKYYTAYKQICEGHEPDDEIARTACKALRKGLVEYGDKPFQMIDDICSELESISSKPLFLPSVDWDKFNKKLDKLVRKPSDNGRAIAMFSDACKSYIHSIRYDGLLSEDHKNQIISHYINKVYISDFEERVPLNQKHYNDENQATVYERLRKIRPHAEKHIKAFAEKISKSDTVKSITDPKHPKSGEPFDIHEDIFEL